MSTRSAGREGWRERASNGFNPSALRDLPLSSLPPFDDFRAHLSDDGQTLPRSRAVSSSSWSLPPTSHREDLSTILMQEELNVTGKSSIAPGGRREGGRNLLQGGTSMESALNETSATIRCVTVTLVVFTSTKRGLTNTNIQPRKAVSGGAGGG
jgi:hypothetical protein